LRKVIDSTDNTLKSVYVSAGQQGLQKEISPRHRISLTEAVTAPIGTPLSEVRGARAEAGRTPLEACVPLTYALLSEYLLQVSFVTWATPLPPISPSPTCSFPGSLPPQTRWPSVFPSPPLPVSSRPGRA